MHKENDIVICVLPYTVGDNVLTSIGLCENKNPERGNFSDTLIHGVTSADDPDMLHCAQRLLNTNGYNIELGEKWLFLGSLLTMTDGVNKVHVFGADVSDINKETIDSELKMTQISDALLTDDAVTLAAFLRLFDVFYQRNKDIKDQ